MIEQHNMLNGGVGQGWDFYDEENEKHLSSSQKPISSRFLPSAPSPAIKSGRGGLAHSSPNHHETLDVRQGERIQTAASLQLPNEMEGTNE